MGTGKQKHRRKEAPIGRPLRIAVDFPWDASAHMGTGAYSESMVRALAAAAPGSTITLIVSEAAPRTIALPNVKYEPLPPAQVLREGPRQVALPALLKTIEADCLFAPATLLPLVKVCPMVATVHDLTFVRKPEYYARALLEYLDRWFDPSLRAADHIVAISQESKAELLELKGIPGDRVTLIQQPVRETIRKPLSPSKVTACLKALGIGQPFFFHVSNLAPHKNVAFALEVFRQFLVSHPDAPHLFIFAGGNNAPKQPPDLEAIARELGVGERVRYAGRVADDTLKALYQGCDAFLFPSLAEGWGLPVAEAAGLGARVLASPHVPAASMGQRIPLDHRRWVQGLADRNVGTEALPPVAFQQAGLELFRVLSGVVDPRPAPARELPSKATPPASAATVRPPGISGCTIIRNGERLRYPFEESIASYASLCDEVIVCWDPTSEDDTAALVRRVAARFPHLRLIESAWDMSNRKEGSELARQTQIAFSHCRHEWSLYIQADEALHERHHEFLKALASDPTVAGVSFHRVSIFGELDREIPDHRTRGMVRMFRTGCGRSVGDAMHVQVEGYPGRILESDATLFNYSRLGSKEDIVTRCSNLHRFYHDDGWLEARDPKDELDIRTVLFQGTHPAPIESSFRSKPSSAHRVASPRISVHVIAQERDRFGADLLASCLDALEGYAGQIVVVDNGLGPEAFEAVVTRRGTLPITLLDGRDVSNDFAELRNRALAATAPGMTHIHKIDSDEVYLPKSLLELTDVLRDPAVDQVNATLVHFMIEPSLVESTQSKEVIFRREDALTWKGAVHEKMAGLCKGRAVNSDASFLHFGYIRPQWQTLLKWLRYATLQGSDLSHYKYEFIDGVKRPWFRDGRTPDTILEPRRHRLEPYKGVYPSSVRPWLDNFAHSGKSWREWINRRAGPALWGEWQELSRSKGAWEETLDEILARWLHTDEISPKPAPAAVSRTLASKRSPFRRTKGEFRKGFSIIIPTWNNLDYLKKAIESIRAYSDFDHEIVLHVNDGSDGTHAWARAAGIKHTHTPENVGICVAINRVTDLCTRDLVMYWNDDMVALPEWDRHIVEYAESHEVDELVWLSSTLIEPTGDNPSFIAPADYGTDVARFDESRLLADLPSLRDRKPDFMGTSWAPNLLYRETFDRVGRFSEEFSPGFGSDPDLAKKLWDIGMRHFVGVGRSLVYHFQCKGTGKIPKHLHNDAQGTFFRKHGLSIQDFIFGVLRRQASTPELCGSALQAAVREG